MQRLTPASFCSELIAALEASEGRRRRRQRNTTPDAIGLAMKRELLERAVEEAPDADEFERWLFDRCLAAGDANGGLQAVALSILEEWRFAGDVDAFRAWLAAGAPSDDARHAEVRT
ncbi:MAG TPA: hypothetical protein VFZ69_15725 [Longimicrobiales bacterium]